MPTPLPVPEGLALSASAPSSAEALPVRLVIPRIGLDSLIVEVGIRLQGGSAVWETASHAVGYHQGTGRPGLGGNVVLSGHISSQFHGNVFHRLPELGVGDVLVVMTAGQQSYLYRVVERAVVLPTAVDVMEPTPEETVTLITCVPDGLYTHRLVVRATRV